MKILLVDDEAVVLTTMFEIVSSVGRHEIFSATNGETALAIAAEQNGIDLLVTDVVMEPMDGFELRQKLLEQFPDLITIFVSGYDLSDFSEFTRGHKIIAKPVQAADLLAAIETAENTLRVYSAMRKEMAEQAVAAPEASDDNVTEAAANKLGVTANLSHLMQRQGFTGQLDQFQLVDIIQMCCISRRTGRLRLSKGVEKGVLFLREGQIVHAVCGKLTGEEAVYRIIDWDFGEFSFDEGITVEVRSIQAGWESVVMEGVRRRDESRGENHQTQDSSQGIIGKVVGDYEVIRKLGDGEWGAAYEARQISVDRLVALKVLRDDLHLNADAVQQFIADASAKANVQHPAILSVYEAGESNGVYYYARELVNGHTLADVAAQGSSLDDQTALRAIRVVSEALSYLNHFKIPHSEIDARNIFISSDGSPLLANPATVSGQQTVPVQQEIAALAKIVSAATQEGAGVGPQVKALLSKMRLQGEGGFLSWGALIQHVRSLEPKVVPKDAFKLSERDEAAIRAVEAEKKRQKKAAILSGIGFLVLIWLVIGVVYWQLVLRKKGQVFDQMVEVPAGEFIFQDGEKKSLPTFWISKYEVSIGMYMKFLDDLAKNPTTEFDHPNQPKGKSHVPARWLLMKEAAIYKKVTFDGAPLELNSPIFNIDWWDAYAYAKWRGHRLPTEEEWEKAARGTDGRTYPWGNEFDPKLVNSSADFSPNPTLKGDIDGFNRWAPVNNLKSDVSPFGAIQMAGNVAEWTATWDDDPQGNNSIPVIRGGHFNSTASDGTPDVRATRRVVLLLPDQSDIRLGLRTVSDTPPKK